MSDLARQVEKLNFYQVEQIVLMLLKYTNCRHGSLTCNCTKDAIHVLASVGIDIALDEGQGDAEATKTWDAEAL